MKKAYIIWTAASAVIMCVLPWMLVVCFNPGTAMSAFMLLLFAVCPVYSVVIGVFAGKDVKRLWGLPVISFLLSLFTMRSLFGPGTSGLTIYSVVYFILGLLAMLVSLFFNRRARRKREAQL